MGRRRPRNGYRQVYVECPFFRDYQDRIVRCEGIMDGTGLVLTFRDREDHRRHMQVFCEDHYKNCEIYRMVMAARYEEDE